ncbi:PREDICTED: triokinase/FMN cyclase-like, partial [Amphimedon queenslandica]|uniref:Triokinase/FMN cyclase n=1 Tax=Amphimedon queenslandica TaxID=400682 RepID=A0AAN0IG23_AMPQE
MSKKLINSPDRAVDESLHGLVSVHPGLRLLSGHRVVLRADIEDLIKTGKVTLLSGGGSGHEPAHAGFVGKGMLSCAVAGAVFASPPTDSILAALKAIFSPAGVLMIVKNYTGDRLNFGIAAERAKSELGLDVRMIIVGEDTALPSTGKSAGRRGLCGTILVHKIAGAMAEKGCSLDEVAATAQEVADSIGTMSVSLSPCSVPGHKPSFQLGENEMELGLGIHGEAGVERTNLQSANEVVARLLDHLTSTESGYQYFNPPNGTNVGLVVNNLGGTSNLELSLIAGSAIDYLTSKLCYNVTRAYMGSLMTSLEMAGVSLTLIRIKDHWTEYLDYPTTAPGWPNQPLGPDGSQERNSNNATIIGSGSKRETELKSTIGPPVTTVGQKMRDCVVSICKSLTAAEEELDDLDRGSGDGDCGSTLKAGAKALTECIDKIPWDEPSEALLSVSDAIERSMGGTSGAIYTLLLTSGSRVIGKGECLSKWVESLMEGIRAVKQYGGADVGDRTMLDSLVPAAKALQRSITDSSPSLDALKAAVEVQCTE